MVQISDSINKKNSILLARNTPCALVVGAASFFGSHLVDKLLDKNIQVVGIDDLVAGEKRNLRKASQNRNFHMVIDSLGKADLDLPRLDYIFIVPGGKWELEKILHLFLKTNCRLLLLSKIDLYSKDEKTEGLVWLKKAEGKIAKFAKENNLNARILRLGPVFGPRMDFEDSDPIIRLINQSLVGDLQKEAPLEFSSRALFILDAVDLAIKTILSGATAQKIFDGVLPTPVKVSEIKQILLDPLWYESRDFAPTEMPPWPTPNLDKTIKHLNWHPKHKLIPSLRETLQYFKDNEVEVQKIEDRRLKMEDNLKGELESFKKEVKPEKKKSLPKFAIPWLGLAQLVVVVLFTYAIIWPCLILGWGWITYQYNLNQGLKSLQKGEFDKGLTEVRLASTGLSAVKSIYETLEPVRKTGVLKEQFELGDNLIALSSFSVRSSESTALGAQALFQSLRAVTGELNESPKGYFEKAQLNLSSAEEEISRAYALSGKRSPYKDLLKKAYTLSLILPKLTALDGYKSYLILLQNNMELRPAGGFIGSFAKISFEGGKLKKLDVNDVNAIDGQLAIHVEPPKEIKDDLGQKDWFLRDSNWEPDFPTAARQAQWFYTKETGEKVNGTIALDITAIEGLLASIGASDNLSAKAVLQAGEKTYLTEVTRELFNKIFFLPQSNWPGIAAVLAKSLEEKHLSIYLDDPKLFSYLTLEGWTHVLPRASDQNKNQDFLAVIEANLGVNKVNYYLDRSYNLETVIGKDGEVGQRLRIAYTNRSPSDAFPGGAYKNRLRIYLPFGTKMERALWAEADITRDVTSFVDYGRSGYSMLLELLPKEQKTLVLDYSPPQKLEFKDGEAFYRLDIIKQAGTLKDPLEWSISYPIGYQLLSQTGKIAPQKQTIQTDLSRDRSFEVEFKSNE